MASAAEGTESAGDTEGAYVGVDIGGTGFRAGIVGWHGEARGPLLDVPRQDDLMAQLSQTARHLRAEAEGMRLALRGVGIAIPGSVDPKTNLVASVPTAPSLLGLDPAQIRFDGIPVRAIVNDANAALVGECFAGAAVGVAHAIGIFVGTGVGGAAIINGELLRGRFGHAGEVGHMVVDTDGPDCPCGAKGCLEQYASGTAVASWYTQRSGRETRTAAAVAQAAAAGDPLALEAFTVMGRHLGTAAATLVNLFNPEVVVVGGGVAAIADRFLAEMERVAKRHIMPLAQRDLEIVVGTLGRWAGVVGAAALATREDDSA